MNNLVFQYLNELEQKIATLRLSQSKVESEELRDFYSNRLKTYKDSMLLSKTIFSPADTDDKLTEKVKICYAKLKHKADSQPQNSFEKDGYRNIMTILQEFFKEILPLEKE